MVIGWVGCGGLERFWKVGNGKDWERFGLGMRRVGCEEVGLAGMV